MIAPEARTYAAALEVREAAVTNMGRFTYLEGRAVPYGQWADLGWFMEQHASGSFKASTKAGTGRQLPLLLFHDKESIPIGHAESWSHDDGLNGVWKLADTPEAQQAAAAAARGDLMGMSIGFQPIRSDWTYVDDWNPDLGPDHKDHVTRAESRLLEVSLTPTPAFADAGVSMVRSALTVMTRAAGAPARAVDHWRTEVERIRSVPAT
jgi:HK97 family phage prohead protease